MDVSIDVARCLRRKEEGMAVRGNVERQVDSAQYTERQISGVLTALGIKPIDYTGTVFICYCPFHANRNTPSFSVNKTNGTWICFNPSCAEVGSLIGLVRRLTHRNEFESLRYILNHAGNAADHFEDDLKLLLEENTFVEFDPELLKRLSDAMESDSAGREYLHNRGFTDETISKFQLGYSANKSMVTIPVHTTDGICVGFVGRATEGKGFATSSGLPIKATLFNIHRAKRLSATAIVTEASFDAMLVDQSGYPNVVATLGGHLSTRAALLDRYFSTVIIATDFDPLLYKDKDGKACKTCLPLLKCKGHNPGRDLGREIEQSLSHKEILWASYDTGMVYPNGAKDLGDLSAPEIRQVIENAVPSVVYNEWELY